MGRSDPILLYIQISDTGIGISPRQIKKLFAPFTQADNTTTRDYEGTGLGLAISKRFCELLGGYINAESEPGKGSVFTIYLPMAMGALTTAIEQKQVAG